MMPVAKGTLYNYACNVCGHEYSSKYEPQAFGEAAHCENKRRFVSTHRFQPGQKFTAITKDPWGTLFFERPEGALIKIVACLFESKTHNPLYHVEFLDRNGVPYQKHTAFPAKNIVFKTVVHRFTSGENLPDGKICVEDRVISSMEMYNDYSLKLVL
ncbi:MAG: hypothetical protein AAB930_03215 [Patescibacteria group bacterium]